ncbi:glutathione S-transferase C-terminal-like protein [Sparassis crispa]|uniref:Glutathione S-transferase C-terminal-like protein n=1 Tax=Sparassis crispa TaxID=139825 RepID=A0A401H4G4_9APHY|nr:glutathione S-transferase C-terminal-like protein [Sparassis crispa]GBE89240.1 glutathione S-transferase C-terminal-like protein [Sparassis crispa]
MPESITLYTAKICPYAQRVELALEEAKAPYTKFQINLQNKPDWYAPLVNPASKVPAIAYGGPAVAADQPSPKSTKLTESLVLIEFVADSFPDGHLLPADPVLRAKARFFIDVVSTKFVPAWSAFVSGKGTADAFVSATEQVTALLPETGFAVGEYSTADIAVTPFLARALTALKNDLGLYPAGEGKKLYDLFHTPRFERLQKYWRDVSSRPSFKATFDEAYIVEKYSARFARQ